MLGTIYHLLCFCFRQFFFIHRLEINSKLTFISFESLNLNRCKSTAILFFFLFVTFHLSNNLSIIFIKKSVLSYNSCSGVQENEQLFPGLADSVRAGRCISAESVSIAIEIAKFAVLRAARKLCRLH